MMPPDENGRFGLFAELDFQIYVTKIIEALAPSSEEDVDEIAHRLTELVDEAFDNYKAEML